jgi:hypothetical protein
MVLGFIFVSLAAQLLMNQGFSYCRGWEGGVFMLSEAVFTAAVGILTASIYQPYPGLRNRTRPYEEN